MKHQMYFELEGFKVELIKVNLSTPVLSKSRCRRCGKHPDVYYYVQQEILKKDARTASQSLNWLKSRISRFSSDWFLNSEPKHFTGINSFSHTPFYKSFNPKLHLSKAPAINYLEYLTCECAGASTWSWMDKGYQTPEHRNRRSRTGYPKTFLY